MGRVTEWQARTLEPIYPVVYLNCIVVKIRENQQVAKNPLYLALGVDLNGHKDLPGIWVSENEGAKFWLSVLTDLRSRGVDDILIACVDGLKGFPEAINSEYPEKPRFSFASLQSFSRFDINNMYYTIQCTGACPY